MQWIVISPPVLAPLEFCLSCCRVCADRRQDDLARWQHLWQGFIDVRLRWDTSRHSSTYHHCHSHLQDKLQIQTVARLRPQWLSSRCKSRCPHKGHSSKYHQDSDSPELQGQCRVGREWAGGEKGRMILKRCFILKINQCKAFQRLLRDCSNWCCQLMLVFSPP